MDVRCVQQCIQTLYLICSQAMHTYICLCTANSFTFVEFKYELTHARGRAHSLTCNRLFLEYLEQLFL